MVSGNNNGWGKRRIRYNDVTRKMFHPGRKYAMVMNKRRFIFCAILVALVTIINIPIKFAINLDEEKMSDYSCLAWYGDPEVAIDYPWNIYWGMDQRVLSKIANGERDFESLSDPLIKKEMAEVVFFDEDPSKQTNSFLYPSFVSQGVHENVFVVFSDVRIKDIEFNSDSKTKIKIKRWEIVAPIQRETPFNLVLSSKWLTPVDYFFPFQK